MLLKFFRVVALRGSVVQPLLLLSKPKLHVLKDSAPLFPELCSTHVVHAPVFKHLVHVRGCVFYFGYNKLLQLRKDTVNAAGQHVSREWVDCFFPAPSFILYPSDECIRHDRLVREVIAQIESSSPDDALIVLDAWRNWYKNSTNCGNKLQVRISGCESTTDFVVKLIKWMSWYLLTIYLSSAGIPYKIKILKGRAPCLQWFPEQNCSLLKRQKSRRNCSILQPKAVGKIYPNSFDKFQTRNVEPRYYWFCSIHIWPAKGYSRRIDAKRPETEARSPRAKVLDYSYTKKETPRKDETLACVDSHIIPINDMQTSTRWECSAT